MKSSEVRETVEVMETVAVNCKISIEESGVMWNVVYSGLGTNGIYDTIYNTDSLFTLQS